jgi:hypothetical protein
MSEKYHFVIDQQNIEKLQKMVDDVGKDINTWIDLTYTPEGLEFTEMLWDPTMNRVIVARTVKYQSEPK